MEEVGINFGYLLMQFCTLIFFMGTLLLSIVFLFDKKGFLLRATTVTVIEVSDQGVVILPELLEGIDAVEVKRKHGILYLVPTEVQK